MTFKIQIKPNFEFWAKVMEHIEDIEINEPEDVRSEFQHRVRKIMERTLGFSGSTAGVNGHNNEAD